MNEHIRNKHNQKKHIQNHLNKMILIKNHGDLVTHNNLPFPAIMSQPENPSWELWTKPETDSSSLLKDGSVWFAERKCGNVWSRDSLNKEFYWQGMHRLIPSGGSGGGRLHSFTCGPIPTCYSHHISYYLILLHPSYKDPRDYIGYQSKISFPSQDPSLWGCASLSCSRQDLWCSTKDLVPWPGIKPGPPSSGVRKPSHWTTREVSQDPSVHHICKVSLATQGNIHRFQGVKCGHLERSHSSASHKAPTNSSLPDRGKATNALGGSKRICFWTWCSWMQAWLSSTTKWDHPLLGLLVLFCTFPQSPVLTAFITH